MAKLNKESAYLLIKDDYPNFSEKTMEKIINALIDINYFKDYYLDNSVYKYSKKDVYIIKEIYTKHLSLVERSSVSYSDLAEIVIESEYPDFTTSLKNRLINYQKRVDEEREYDKNNQKKGFKNFLNPFSTRVAGESYKPVKYIKIVFIVLLTFTLAATIYTTFMSTTDVGIQHKFEEVMKKEKSDYRNFSTSGNYNIGKETHSVFTYMDNDGFWAVDLNLSKSKVTNKELINDKSTINNPLILIQLYNILKEKDDNFSIKDVDITNDSIIINDVIYKLNINNTQITSINNKELESFNNVLFTQRGQLELLEEYNIDVSDIIIESLLFDKQKELFQINFITDGVNDFQLITYNNQKVVINQIPKE